MQRRAGKPAPDERAVRVTSRVLLVALGAVGGLLGLGLAAVGAVLLLLTGGEGRVGGREATLSTPAYALVSDAAGLGDGEVAATVRVRVAAAGGRPVFVGVGPAAEVDRYLAGVAYDELTDVRLTPLRYVPVRSAGTAAPAPPAGRPVWTVSATGPGEQTVEVRVGDGGQPRVVMDADASAGVEVRASVSLRADFLRRLAIGLLVAGVVVAPVGGLLVVAGVRRTVRARGE